MTGVELTQEERDLIAANFDAHGHDYTLLFPAVAQIVATRLAPDSAEGWAAAIAAVTPCSCSAQRARAEAAEAEVATLREQVRNLHEVCDREQAEVARLTRERDENHVEAERLRAGLRRRIRDWAEGWDDAERFDQRDGYRSLQELLGADFNTERTWLASASSEDGAE